MNMMIAGPGQQRQQMVADRDAGEIDDQQQQPGGAVGSALPAPDVGQPAHRRDGEGGDGVDLGLVRVLPVGEA